MNRRNIVLLTGLGAAALFAGGAYLYTQHAAPTPATPEMAAMPEGLVREHAPIMGPQNAKVTIVEFFDPACEACRGFYPYVKQIMATHPNDVRLMLRYAAFHQGSDQAVGILEAARKQDKFQPVLEALLEKQAEWASHDGPNLDRAWAIAGETGLDLTRARQDAVAPEVATLLAADMADVKTVGITGTPSFFVNGKPLTVFGPEPLRLLVQSEVEAANLP
jgi:protein-disulfide isomerase